VGVTRTALDLQTMLTALCDTLIPAVEETDRGTDKDFLARAGSDAGLPHLLAAALEKWTPDARREVEQALQRLDDRGFITADDRRPALLEAELSHPRFYEFATSALALFYGLADKSGHNPNWHALGYPGPIASPPSADEAPKTIPVEEISGRSVTLAADVCVVGSGAGGSVIAAELQGAGASVVVLERGGYRNETDFVQLEHLGAAHMFLRGGMFFSVDGSLGLLAGSTLGGGTVINSMVCLRPPDRIREAWAQSGVTGLDAAAFDAHLDAVSQRINVNTAATVQNTTSRLLARGIERFGLSWQTIGRNASLDDDPRYCGYCHNGCLRGCKQSTLKTYLQDASDAGARFVVECTVSRVLNSGRRAVGVEGTVAHQDGSVTAVTVRASTVVLAAGGIESPAVLLRSGIGGPAVGRYLRVHPTYFVGGIYPEPVRGWEGQVQSVVSLDRTTAVEGDGYLIECTTISPGMWAALTPWLSGRDHKRRMLDFESTAPFHAVAHDHGAGRVVLDRSGEALVHWQFDDPVDRSVAALGHVELAQMHKLAGAVGIVTTHAGGPEWREGDDFDSFLEAIGAERPDTRAYSAHQMGSCRMGADPETSVANGSGQLHDVSGVWIGDASAFPSAPGVNPMITTMAVARRTAHNLLAHGGVA
jgi:choline dehydrogenase-like flavoprotein